MVSSPRIMDCVCGRRPLSLFFSSMVSSPRIMDGLQSPRESVSGHRAAHGMMTFDDDKLPKKTESLDEDLFGFAVCSLVRDIRFIEVGQQTGLRLSRVIASQCLVFANIAVQIFLLSQIKLFVTARAVHDIRDAYDSFELDMYGPNHVSLTGNGNHRGSDASAFNATRFNLLSADRQAAACRIPFSQPCYIFAILFIWTLTCIGQLRVSLGNFQTFVYGMPTVKSMQDGLVRDEEDRNQMLIHGITMGLKIYILLCVILPRAVITCTLLWLGCRWLVATTDFNDVLLNAVALEMILLLKDVVYMSIVPDRNKRDLQNTKVRDDDAEALPPNLCTFLGTFLWLAAAIAWTYLYIYFFQMVLPGYRWDVHDVCTKWIAQRYALTKVPVPVVAV